MTQLIGQGVALSAGTLRADSGTVVFSNSNNVSFGMSSRDGSDWSLGMSATPAAIQSISAGTTIASTGEVVFGADAISFGVNGQTITGGFTKVHYWDNRAPLQIDVNGAQPALGRPIVQVVSFPHPIDATRADILVSVGGASSTVASFTLSLGLYTMQGSTASLLTSTSAGFSWTSGSATSVSSEWGGNSGINWHSFPLGTISISQGEYLIGSIVQSGGNNASPTLAGAGSIMFTPVPGENDTPFWTIGFYSTTSGALPSSIQLSEITGTSPVLANIRTAGYIRLLGTF